MILRPLKAPPFFASTIAAAALVCGFSHPATAQQADAASHRVDAEKLAALRIEVDELDAGLRSRRARMEAELRGLETRLAELKVEEDATLLKVRSLSNEHAELTARSTRETLQKATLVSAVEAAVTRLKTAVKSGLPYKTDARLSALSQIREDLRTGRTVPEEAAVRLWRFAEDERRMGSSIERSETKLSVKSGEPPMLVQAVRVGMVALYTYSTDGTWGSVVRDEKGKFSFSAVQDKAQIRDIRRLFESVEKKIYEGRYTLPLGRQGAAQQ